MVQKEEVCQDLNNQPDTCKRVQEIVIKSHQKISKRKLSQGTDDNFQVENVVLKLNIREQQQMGGKMAADMLRPFTVTGIKRKHVSLASKNCKLMAVLDQLAHDIELEERIPSKLLKGSFSPLAIPPAPASPHQPPPALPAQACL